MLNSINERKNNKKYIYSKQIIKSFFIFLILILLFIKFVDEKKINKNSPLFPLEFKCSNNENLKSLIFEIKNKSYINLAYYNTLYSKNLIYSIFGHNFSFFGLHNFARENTLVKLGFSKKKNGCL